MASMSSHMKFKMDYNANQQLQKKNTSEHKTYQQIRICTKKKTSLALKDTLQK